MKIGVYYVQSTNADGENINRYNHELVDRLSAMTGLEMAFVDLPDAKKADMLLVFIGGGGTEGRFKEALPELPQPVLLIMLMTLSAAAMYLTLRKMRKS